MMYSKRHLPNTEQWSQSSGSNVIPRRARPGLAGLKPHKGGNASLKVLRCLVQQIQNVLVHNALSSDHRECEKVSQMYSREESPRWLQGYLAHKKPPPPRTLQ